MFFFLLKETIVYETIFDGEAIDPGMVLKVSLN